MIATVIIGKGATIDRKRVRRTIDQPKNAASGTRSIALLIGFKSTGLEGRITIFHREDTTSTAARIVVGSKLAILETDGLSGLIEMTDPSTPTAVIAGKRTRLELSRACIFFRKHHTSTDIVNLSVAKGRIFEFHGISAFCPQVKIGTITSQIAVNAGVFVASDVVKLLIDIPYNGNGTSLTIIIRCIIADKITVLGSQGAGGRAARAYTQGTSPRA